MYKTDSLFGKTPQRFTINLQNTIVEQICTGYLKQWTGSSPHKTENDRVYSFQQKLQYFWHTIFQYASGSRHARITQPSFHIAIFPEGIPLQVSPDGLSVPPRTANHSFGRTALHVRSRWRRPTRHVAHHWR